VFSRAGGKTDGRLSWTQELKRRAATHGAFTLRLADPEPGWDAPFRPRDDFYASAHPGPNDVLLVIEIADSSLRYDRDFKGPLYARAGIVEFWLVDLDARSVTCHSEPSNGMYRRSVTSLRDQSLAPFLMPETILRVDDLRAD
jgi:Uma2 family endonuclease